MVGQQMPFQFTVLSSSDPHTFKDGQIISTFNKCGVFFCRRGNVEVSLEDKLFQIKPGDVYIYIASTLVHLLHKSEDAEGIMVEVYLDYIIPCAACRGRQGTHGLFCLFHPAADSNRT